MLRKISLANFKGFSSVNIELSKLNLFVGENGTGKSTLIQALSILKRSLGSSGIVTDLPFMNLGPLHDIVPPAKTASITVEGTVPMDLKPIKADGVEFKCVVKFDVQGLFEYEAQASPQRGLMDIKVHNIWTRYGANAIEPRNWKYGNVTYVFGATNNIGWVFGPGGYSPATPLPPDEAKVAADIYASLEKLSRAIMEELNRIYVVPTTRGLTEPKYPLQPGATTDFSPRAGPIPMGTALASNLVYYSYNEEKISSWQKQILGAEVKHYLEPGPAISIRNPENKVSYVNEGFGSNQMLFILERIANSPDDSLVAIEEPEIHLHPKAQFRFGLLASQIVKDEGKQLLITTHSEHIVSGVLTSIKNGRLEPQDVSIWFFEKKGLENTATYSEVDKEGKTSGGLKSFLEAAVEELSEYVRI
jgi:energy-coupling factor transporter ATP-binding protein EcfA2